jgi:hypothetical protein
MKEVIRSMIVLEVHQDNNGCYFRTNHDKHPLIKSVKHKGRPGKFLFSLSHEYEGNPCDRDNDKQVQDAYKEVRNKAKQVAVITGTEITDL